MEFGEQHPASTAPLSASARTTTVVVSALIRDTDPDARAAAAERRLLRTIAEWTPGAGIDILMRSSARGARVTVTIAPLGPVAPSWTKDVSLALAEIAAVTRRQAGRRRLAEPARLAELVRDPARATRLADETASPRDTIRLGASDVVWPLPVRSVPTDLLDALRATPGGFVRMLLAAPDPLEREMLQQEMLATWDRQTHPDFDTYLGSPVLMRTFVGSTTSAAGDAGLRSIVRGWGTGLVLRQATPAERVAFPEIDAEATRGFVRPQWWALALLRLPAAGTQPVLGIPSRDKPPFERPIEARLPQRASSLSLGTALTVFGSRVPVTIDAVDLCRHLAIEGQSGSGKTTLLARLVAELTRLGFGCTLLDHHGSGVDLALRALSPAAAERAIVVRHGDADAPGVLNLFSERDPAVLEQLTTEFIELIQSIYDPQGSGIVGPRWRRWFALLREGVAAFWGDEATLLHLIAVAVDPARVKRLAARLAASSPDLAKRLNREIASLTGDEATTLPAWALSKFQPLVSQQAMRKIVGRAHDTVDVAAAIDEGRTLLVDLAGTRLGAPSARILGSLWLLKHWVAMGRRADPARPHVIVVDEAHLYTFGALPAMLAEARKYGIGIVIASQTMDALAPALRIGIEANVGSHVSFRLGLDNAPRASARLAGWPVTDLTRLPDLRAATTLTRGSVRTEPFLLTVSRPATDTAEARAQATAIDARCARTRHDAEARQAVVTDSMVDSALGIAAPTEHGPAPKAEQSTDGFLDHWLEERRRLEQQRAVQQAEDAAADQPTR